MMRNIYLMVSAFCLCVVMSCDSEDINTILEKELEQEPEVIFRDTRLKMSLDSEVLYDDFGDAVFMESSSSYVISSDSIICNGGGSYSAQPVVASTNKVSLLNFFQTPDSIIMGFSLLIVSIDNVATPMFLSSIDSVATCPFSSPSLTIDSVASDIIIGSVQGFGYISKNDDFDIDNCDDFERAGWVEIDFALEVERCD